LHHLQDIALNCTSFEISYFVTPKLVELETLRRTQKFSVVCNIYVVILP